MALVCATIAGTLVWDRLCVWLWGGKVYQAMADEARSTTLKDITPVLLTAAKIVGVILVLGTGNIMLAGIGYYYYRQYVQKTSPQDTPAPSMMSSCAIM